MQTSCAYSIFDRKNIEQIVVEIESIHPAC